MDDDLKKKGGVSKSTEMDDIKNYMKKKGDEVHYDSKTRETKEDKIEYYNPKKEDKAEWFKLKIYVLPFQKIKYNSK